MIISLFFLSCFEANAQQKSATALYLNSLGYVNVAEQDSSILVSLMYARSDNFTGKLLYNDLREAYLHKDAIAPLLKAQRLLHEVHPDYNLIIFDAARPMHVQQQMWDVVKGTRQQIYVSNPARGGGCHAGAGPGQVHPLLHQHERLRHPARPGPAHLQVLQRSRGLPGRGHGLHRPADV